MKADQTTRIIAGNAIAAGSGSVGETNVGADSAGASANFTSIYAVYYGTDHFFGWQFDDGPNVQDLLQYPLRREFVLLQRSWTYNGAGYELCYFYDDYNDLEGMISILCNYNLVRDITFNNVKRYIFLEELVDYLTQSRTEV